MKDQEILTLLKEFESTVPHDLDGFLSWCVSNSILLGVDSYRSIEDLHGDFQKGEGFLYNDGSEWRRLVRVAMVDVEYLDFSGQRYVLYEKFRGRLEPGTPESAINLEAPEFIESFERPTTFSLSERMRTSTEDYELPREAVTRAALEELFSSGKFKHINSDVLRKVISRRIAEVTSNTRERDVDEEGNSYQGLASTLVEYVWKLELDFTTGVILDGLVRENGEPADLFDYTEESGFLTVFGWRKVA